MSNIDLNNPTESYAKLILKGIGGKDNIKFITNCMTRLRLVLADVSLLDENLLINETGASKVIVDGDNVHVIYGLNINQVKNALDNAIKNEKANEGYIGNVNVQKIFEGIGGKDNIVNIDNCMTRLRLKLKDVSKVNEDILVKETGASKVIFIDESNIHIVYGLKIEEVRKAIEEALK